MQNVHTELLPELARLHIDERVRAASRASASRTARSGRLRGAGRSRPRHRLPFTSA